MKRLRTRLSLTVLLPAFVLIALGLSALYVGGYLVLRDSAFEAAERDDQEDLAGLNGDVSENNYTHLGYALPPVIRAYEANKPAFLPPKGSAEEQEYQEYIAQKAGNQLYSTLVNRIIRYTNTWTGFLYEDTSTNRMVVVCSTDPFRTEDNSIQLSSMYVGYFFTRTSVFDNTEFYGQKIWDDNLGEMYASGLYIGEVKPVKEEDGPFRIWVLHETLASEVYGALPRFSRNFAITAAITMVALSLLIYVLLTTQVVRPLRKLSASGNHYIDALKGGENIKPFALSAKRFQNEVTDVNDALYFTQEAIDEYTTKIREATSYEEKMRADLATAERIQHAMVPSAPLSGDNFLIRGHMTPAKEVGGDLYNYFRVDERHVGFFIGDVSGKGVPAALFMAKANTLLRLKASDVNIDEANNILCEDNEENFFVTAFIGLLDLVTGELRYVNCGHEPVFISRNGVYEALDEEPNFMLGCLPDFGFTAQKTTLLPGDRLFLYTDGVSEAMNARGELFGKGRILECLNAHTGLPSDNVLNAMYENVAAFVGKAEQSDDICMVALDYANEKALDFPADPEGLKKVQPFVDDFIQGDAIAILPNIQVILDELCSNVAFYSGSVEKGARLILRDDGRAIYGSLLDYGTPFNPLEHEGKKEDFTEEGGLGIIMVRSMCDDVQYRYADGKNILQFHKFYK